MQFSFGTIITLNPLNFLDKKIIADIIINEESEKTFYNLRFIKTNLDMEELKLTIENIENGLYKIAVKNILNEPICLFFCILYFENPTTVIFEPREVL